MQAFLSVSVESAGHSHKGVPGDGGGNMYRLVTVQNMSAVTGACLMVKKALYEELWRAG